MSTLYIGVDVARVASTWTRYRRLRFALLLAVPLVLLSFSRVELIDDAYISARYARNLARGEGLVFNPGEYVEGMTNLAWTLLLALPARLGLPVDVAAVALGLLCGLLAMLMAGRLARLLGASVWASYAAMLLIGLSHHYWLTVPNGLEGGLFSLLLACTLESVLARRRPAISGALAGLLFLTRPESGLVAIVIALHLLLEDCELRRPRFASAPALRAMLFLFTFGAVAGAVTLFRITYYGALLPNSVTAKSVPWGDLGFLAANVVLGAKYVVFFVRGSFALVAGSMLALWLAPSRKVWLLAAVVASELPAVLLNGGDWVSHGRLLIVYAPLLAASFALTLDRLWALALLGGSRRHLAVGVVAALGAALAVSLLHNPWRASPSVRIDLQGINECYRSIGERLAPVLGAGDVVGSEALGLIGHQLPDVYVHDPLGLTDAWIARHGEYVWRTGHRDYAYTYKTIHPGVLLTHQHDVLMERFAEASDGRFAREYTAYFVDPPLPCAPYHNDDHTIRLVVAVRNDLHDRVVPALASLPLTPFAAPLAFRARAAL